MPLPLAISIRDAALALSLSPWTVRKYIAKGIIPSVRIGRRVLIEPSKLEKLIAQNRRNHHAGSEPLSDD
jgi:excisionase family DNA binding protein